MKRLLDWIVIGFPTLVGLRIALWPPKPEMLKRTAFKLSAVLVGLVFSGFVYADLTMSDREHQREVDAMNGRLDQTAQKLDESNRELADTGRKLDESNRRLDYLATLVQQYAASVKPGDKAALTDAIRQAVGEIQTASQRQQPRPVTSTPPPEVAASFPDVSPVVFALAPTSEPIAPATFSLAPPSNVVITLVQ